MRTKMLGVCVVMVAAAALTGCASHTKTPSSDGAVAVNTTCPIGGHEVEAGAPTVAYKGTVIGFCCDSCVNKFEKMTAEEKDTVLAKATGR